MTIEEHREMPDSTPHAAPPVARHEADTSTRRDQSAKTGSGAVMLTAGGWSRHLGRPHVAVFRWFWPASG